MLALLMLMLLRRTKVFCNISFSCIEYSARCEKKSHYNPTTIILSQNLYFFINELGRCSQWAKKRPSARKEKLLEYDWTAVVLLSTSGVWSTNSLTATGNWHTAAAIRSSGISSKACIVAKVHWNTAAAIRSSGISSGAFTVARVNYHLPEAGTWRGHFFQKVFAVLGNLNVMVRARTI